MLMVEDMDCHQPQKHPTVAFYDVRNATHSALGGGVRAQLLHMIHVMPLRVIIMSPIKPCHCVCVWIQVLMAAGFMLRRARLTYEYEEDGPHSVHCPCCHFQEFKSAIGTELYSYCSVCGLCLALLHVAAHCL
jgi:hypothetical protein